jgi:hypothetical protein
MRIGVIGFPAGGEVASLASLGPTTGQADTPDPIDRVDGRPDFVIEIHPGEGVPEQVARDVRPPFLLLANDDRGASRTVAALFQKDRGAQAPVKTHVLPRGGHGFKMAGSSRLAALRNWL